MSNKPLPPFSCTYSPHIPELIWQLKCSVAISTYQAGKVVFISASDQDHLVQLPRSFKQAMGITIDDGHRMAIGTHGELVVFGNSPELARTYPPKPNTYDAMYIPKATYHTGFLDLHDLEWGDEGLWAVNTQFSCLSLINDKYSFEPKWKPHFITALEPGDRCHLNGLAMENGKPKYVSALGVSDVSGGWREKKATGGIIMDVASNEIVATGLGMPHTPKMYNGKLYVLLSATGELVCVDVNTGKYDVVTRLNGFVRGMSMIDDYLFIGLSKIRTTSAAFRDLPISKQSVFSGVVVVYLPQGSIVGHIQYKTSVEEIYSVQVLPNMRRPSILNKEKEDFRYSLATPENTFWGIRDSKEKKSQEETS